MSTIKSGSSLRTLLLTPDRIPDFLIPSRSPLRYLSPRLHRSSPVRTRLLSDHDDDSPGESPPQAPLSPAASRGFLLYLPSPRVRHHRHATSTAAAEYADEDTDTDLTTRAAMSLPHVEVTTPCGFHAMLAETSCTRQRESLFHKPVTEAVMADSADPPLPPAPSRSPAVSLRSVKALGLQVMKELKKAAAALKALSPANRKTPPR